MPSEGGSYFSILDFAFGLVESGLREVLLFWNVLRKSVSVLGISNYPPGVVFSGC